MAIISRRWLTTFYLCLLFGTCFCMAFEVSLSYYIQSTQLATAAAAATTTREGWEGLGVLSKIGDTLGKIGRMVDQVINFFAQLPDRIASITMGVQDTKLGIVTELDTLKLGVSTSKQWFERNLNCPAKKEGCHTYFFVKFVINAITKCIAKCWGHFMEALGLGEANDLMYEAFSEVVDPLVNNTVVDSINPFKDCELCNAMTNDEIQYNMDVVIPTMQSNAETYFRQADCEFSHAVRPL